MTYPQRVTNRANRVTKDGDTLARARLSFGEGDTLSPVTVTGDKSAVTGDNRERDSDSPGLRPVPSPSRSGPSKSTAWHVIAAMLLADHRLGRYVDPAKLKAARALLGVAE